MGHRQLEVAVTHCKLDPLVANFMRVLCSREIYKWVIRMLRIYFLNSSFFFIFKKKKKENFYLREVSIVLKLENADML